MAVEVLRRFRLFRLGEVATRAEAIRWRRHARAYAVRVGLGAAAAVCAVLLLLALHVALWGALLPALGSVGAALVVLLLDMAVFLTLAMVAMTRRAGQDATVSDAGAVRDAALQAAGQEVTSLGGLLERRDGRPLPLRRSRRVRVYPDPS